MNLDSVAFDSESESVSDETTCSRAPAQARLSETSVRKIADLFQDDYAKLVHYLVARTKSWPEARDIAAQAFAQVLEMRNPETVVFLKAYVYRAARNLATDRARAGAIHNRIHRIVRHEFASTTPSPEPMFMQEQRLKVLEAAIEALKPTRKMLVRWRMWEELSYTDIASRFAAAGVSVNERTLFRWYAEALKELRQAILTAEDAKREIA